MLPRVRTAMHEYLRRYLPPLRERASFDSYLRAPGLGTHSGLTGALLLARTAVISAARETARPRPAARSSHGASD